MDNATAASLIETALNNMEQVIGEPVFDEWAVVRKNASSWNLLEYGGSRKDDFIANFNTDVAALRNTLDPSATHIGDFAFSHEGYGSGFDAHMCIGEDLLVLFNNTEKSTGEITSNPKWTSAQIHFAKLLEIFITDPLNCM